MEDFRKERISGFEDYQVDTNGVVYSKKGKPLKYSINCKGYCIVNFCTNHTRKGFGVHTLVAKQFLPNRDSKKTQINHKDGNKQNNTVSNLEWVSPTENMRHSVDVLGNYTGAKNYKATPIIGRDKKTLEVKYKFNAIIEAGRFFSKENEEKARRIQIVIWKSMQGTYGNKTYRGCIWEYA